MKPRRSVRSSLALGVAMLAMLAVLALLVLLARPPVARDEPELSPLSSPNSSGADAAASDVESLGALPDPAAGAVAPLLTRVPVAAGAAVLPRRWVRGQVVRAADGTPLVGAIVRVTPPSTTTPTSHTQEPDGRFELWPRTETEMLKVGLSQSRGWPHASQTFRIEPGEKDLEDLRLEYDSGFTLTGQVIDQDGHPVPSAWVTLSASGGKVTEHADEGGRYTLRDLTPPPSLGTASIAAAAPGYVDAHAELQLTGDDAELRTLDLVLQLGGLLEIRAHLPGGEPIPNSDTVLLSSQPPFQYSCDRDYFLGARFRKLPPGEYTVIAAPPDGESPPLRALYAPVRLDGVVVTAGSNQRLDVTLQPGATLSGRVTDAAGAPLGHADVWLEAVALPAGYRPDDPSTPPQVRHAMAAQLRYGAGIGPGHSTRTGPSGEFEVAGVPAGPVRVVAQARGLVRASIELTVVAGEARSRVDFTLRPGLELAGRVTLPDGSPMPACTRVLVLPAGAGSDEVLAMTETGMQGDFRADGLEAGPKRLLVVGSDGSWVDARVKPGGESQTFVASR